MIQVPDPVIDPALGPTVDAGTGDRSSAAERVGTSDGRYTLRRELARGGMGRIWVADDARLSRRVAIKELLEPGGGQRARFDRELALTSRLEHPSIVSIHDGGTWADGKPFYVMKLVSGESFDRVIARATNLADRIALLPHGLAVVDAVSYAHAQGIVHRDLKPANVLVGDFGETVVIDWGLAKDLRATMPELTEGPYRGRARMGETVGGEVIGTPSYMPPEQALGDAVAERADVYALGAMLYHLLSGAPPHQGTSIEDVLVSVISAPPPPLVTRVPGVPADLVTIIEKAMARKPEDRYATAAELAVDLKRFHGGQLVGAHRYTGRQLLWRWLRKHRTAAVVASVATIALVTLGSASFSRIVREEREAQDARRSAELHRGEAEQNHAKAEGLVSFMLVDLRAKLEPIGKLDLLEGVALQARDYYRDQAAATTADEQHRRALALHGLGQVLGAKGEAAAALAEHQAALAIHVRLAAKDLKWQPSLAESYTTVANALRTRGDSEAALAAYHSGLAINERLATAGPGDAVALQQLAASYAGIGDFYAEVRRDIGTALRERRRALALHERLVALAPDAAGPQRDLVASHAGVADMLMHLGEFPQALAEHRKALSLAETLASRDPADAISQVLLADRNEEVGGVLHNQGELAGALGHYQAALATRERLAAKDPTNALLEGTIARAHMNIGQVHDELGKLAGALEHHRAALAVFAKLLRVDASSIRLRANHAFVERLVGSVLMRQGQHEAAIAAFESSRVTAEKLAVEEPANETRHRDLEYLYSDLADALAERGDFVKSLALRQQALNIAERIAARDPKNTSSQSDVADAVRRLAETLERNGDATQALAAYRRALTLGEALSTQGSAPPGWVEQTTELRKRVAACCKRSARR